MKKVKLTIFFVFIFFISLANAKALSCIYQNGNLQFTCNVSENSQNNNVGCVFKTPIFTKDPNYQNLHIRLKKSDYETSDKRLVCSQVSTIYVDMLKTKSSWNLYDIRKDNNGCPLSKNEYNKNQSEYEASPSGCVSFSLKNNASSSTTETKPSGGNSSGNNSGTTNNSGNNSSGNNLSGDQGTTSNIDLEHFCKGNVLTVFRAVGWIFFAMKIIVPLLLIMFGVIDFAKAVISSKDDEIKKSVKSLVIRSIAGIIVFFVPHAINIVVQVVGGEDVYRGSEFGACTECMLDPNSNSCK